MAYSRVKKYQSLRDGIKDEVSIKNQPVFNQEDNQEDDFLSFMKKDEEEVNFEDTLTESKTFEQIRREGSEEVNKALKTVKESVGRETQYDTRMDILNKIRGFEKEKVIDSYEQYETSEFSKGVFISDKKPVVEEEPVEEKPKTLMERLAEISAREEDEQVEEITEYEETVEEPVKEELNSYEDKLEELYDQEEKESLGVKILDYIIVLLIVVIIVLLGILIYQQIF